MIRCAEKLDNVRMLEPVPNVDFPIQPLMEGAQSIRKMASGVELKEINLASSDAVLVVNSQHADEFDSNLERE